MGAPRRNLVGSGLRQQNDRLRSGRRPFGGISGRRDWVGSRA